MKAGLLRLRARTRSLRRRPRHLRIRLRRSKSAAQAFWECHLQAGQGCPLPGSFSFMKTLVCLLAVLLLAGCGGKSDKSPTATNSTSSGGNPLNAPADYLRGLKKAEDSAVKTVDTSRLTQAIQLFNVEKG